MLLNKIPQWTNSILPPHHQSSVSLWLSRHNLFLTFKNWWKLMKTLEEFSFLHQKYVCNAARNLLFENLTDLCQTVYRGFFWVTEYESEAVIQKVRWPNPIWLKGLLKIYEVLIFGIKGLKWILDYIDHIV